MKLTLRIWRQRNADQPGEYQSHRMENVSPDLSLLEALDLLSEVFLRPWVNHHPSSGMGRWHHKAAARNCPSVRPVPAWNRSVLRGWMRLR